MITDRYYFNRLTPKEKEIYTTLYKGVTALDKEIYFPKMVTQDEISRIFHAVTHDNPHLYYFNQTHMDIGMTPFGSLFLPQYFCNREQIETYNGRIQECVSRIVSDMGLLNYSELEKEKRVHDYLCLNCTYDHEALNTSKVNRLVAAHSIIGVFAKQRAVCEGIAKATKLILNTVDVGCIVVSGKASLFQRGEHAWNIVKVNGQAYQLDTTWDMANTKNGMVNYDYFNLTDAAISTDHFDFEGVPACTAVDANYFLLNQLKFKNVRQLESYLLKGIKRGQTSFYFQVANDGHTMHDVIMAAQSFAVAEASDDHVRMKVKASYNEEQRTGRIMLEPAV